MPVVVSTAPVHTLPPEAERPINKPVLIFTPEEGVAAFGALPPGASKSDYPILQALEVYLSRYRMAPVCVINVFDPEKHVDAQGKPDVKKVTTSDIIGGIDAAGQRSGLELIDKIYPKFQLIPGQIIAPGFDDPAVSLVIGAKCAEVSGNLDCIGIADIPYGVKYTEASEYLLDNNLTDKNLIMFFGRPVFNDTLEFGCLHWAGITAQRDNENESSIPYWSPSNKRLLANGMASCGKELLLDTRDAAYLNGCGVVTGMVRAGGLVGWGNRTSCYPGITDPKDSFIPLRRMFNFVGNTLVMTADQFADRPLNRRQKGTVCDTFNVWLNGLARREYLLGGRCEFLAGENPNTDIMDGISNFHVFLTPPSPNREMNIKKEYDPNYINTLYAA
jgi:phage tail sheath protein FI